MTQATLSGKISPILFHPNHPSPTPSPSLRQGATSVGSASRSPLPKRHSMRQNKSNSEPVQPVRPHDEDTAGWADDEELSPQLLKRQKRRRPRTHALAKKRCRKFSERQDSAHSKSSIVRRMLASPGSLLRMCLRHSNYLKADEVLKMFGMEGQFGEVFVRFLEQYETVSQELSQRSRSTSPKQSPFVSTPAVPSPRAGISQSLSLPSSLATLRSLTSSLGTPLSLQVAIVNATNSSVALESLHRLLAPSSINRMLFSGDELLEKAAKESHRLQVLSENVPTLVMLDIVCSSKVDGRVAKRVIELATERCQAAALAAPRSRGGGVSHHRRGSPERKWSQEVTLSGPLPLLLTLSDISGYFTSLSALPPSPGISSPPHTSPHTLLTAYAHQMKVSAIMNVRMFTESYRNARLRLAEQELLQTQKDCVGQRDILSEILQASESGGLAVQQPTSGSIFEELIRSLKSNPYYPSLPNSSRERSLMRHPSASSLVLDAGSGEVMTAYVPLVSRYLSKMADLLLSCLGGGGGGGDGTLPLLIVHESPSHILGWLIFEKSIRPQRLELLMTDAMAKFPHLRIEEVLLKCCCPHLPSSASPRAPALPGPPAPSIISLNDGEVTGSVPDPCAYSKKLLKKMVAILKDSLLPTHTQDGVLGPEEILAAYQKPEMQAVLAKAIHLVNVDLELLDTSSKQMSFYSNIVNFLYAHVIMAFLASEREGAWQGEESGGNPLSMLGSSGLSLSTLQSSEVAQAALYSKVGYHVGQLGLISCYDLHHSVLRKGLSPAQLGLKIRIAPVKPDPWSVFTPTSPDPRLLYVVHTGQISSPIPTVLSPDTIISSLSSAETRLLSAWVTVNLTEKEVSVPSWIYHHRDDFTKPIWTENVSDATHGSLSDLALLRYLQSRLPREQAELLLPLLEAGEIAKGKRPPFKVSVRKESMCIGYNFDPKRAKSPKSSPRVRRKKAKEEKKAPLEEEVEGADRLPVKYSFTPETLAFVRQRSPLLAALAHLLCPPLSGKTRKTGQTSPMEKEEELETGKDDEETAPRRQKLQSFRARPKQPPPLQKRLSLDEKAFRPQPAQPWQRQLDELLFNFESALPMKRYLRARLGSYDSILPWDPPTPKDPPKGSAPQSHFSLRRLAALPVSSRELGDACSYAMLKLIEAGRATEAVTFLSSEPAASHTGRVTFFADMAISSLFVAHYLETMSVGKKSQKENGDKRLNPLSLLAQLSSPELATRLALPSLHNWPVELAVDILRFCSNHLPLSSPLVGTVNHKLERMRVYAEVMASCDNPLSPVTAGRRRANNRLWSSWMDLASMSESKPDYVLRVLLESENFPLARKWAAVHGLGAEVTQQIEVDYIFVLLEGETPDPATAQQVLDGLANEQLALSVCESVLEHCAQLPTTIFTLHYMLTRLAHHIHKAKTQEYCNRLLGAKALLCLPGSVRRNYETLVSEPMLLVEQLLLDMKINWAGSVIARLRSDEHISELVTLDPPTLDHTPIILSEGDLQDPFTVLLMFYTSKALDFPQPVLTRSASQQQIVPPTPSTIPVSPGAAAPPERRQSSRGIPCEPPSDYSFSRRLSTEFGLSPSDPYPAFTPRPAFTGSQRRPRTASSVLSPPPPLGTKGERLFEIPAVPPPRSQWERDASVAQCRVCRNVYFSMFSRRHHCRRCGRVVCADCSSHLMHVEGYAGRVRACSDCYRHYVQQSGSASDDSLMEGGPPYLGSIYPALSSSPLQQWRLLPNDSLYNQNIRKSFYYERTPSTALCLALVDLMNNLRVEAAYLLDCCHTVSTQLIPDSQGYINVEVDQNFVIGLIQNLLHNAKLRFAEAGDSPGVELCDTYLSRVDLLRLLVSSRWTRIPSIQELTKPDLARRVRDRLIEDDRFALAMEVSTKCQLDATAVWAAWGMAALRCGDFGLARDKFLHCFQVSSQSGLRGQNVPLLLRIVEQIEQSPLSVIGRQSRGAASGGRHADYSDDWSSVIVSSTSPTERRMDDCDLDIRRFNECTFYIRTFGSHSMMVTFFTRHNCWMDACKYILEYNCPKDVFVDYLWVPALKSGAIDQVQQCLSSLDASLTAWEPYLTAACLYFSQRALYSVLYHTQLFMKDHVRAGMTCIKFFIGFSGRSTVISDLYSRLHYLHTAQRHFQTALEAKQHRTDRRSGRSRGYRQTDDQARVGVGSGAKSLSVTELQNHINTIRLQISVTEFLYHSAEAAGTLRDSLPMAHDPSPSTTGRHAPQQPATLFSNGHVRAEVAVQLLSASQDIIEGFSRAEEIIQAYRLPVSRIFCDASRSLALRQNYGDIRLLLQSIQKSRFASDSVNDDVIMAAIKVLSDTKESKQVEKLVLLLTSDRSKIKANVQCGKLKSAYLIAIKSKMVREVEEISEIAGKAGQLAVRDICEKWLQANAPHR